jgi:hypothetical protein
MVVLKAMTNHHYLPAAFMSRFSLSTTVPVRKRAVWMYSSKAQKLLLVSNDLGLGLTQNLENGEVGWAIPIDTNTFRAVV